jgi:hypothetical protein
MFQEEQRLKKDLQTNGGLVHCLQVDQSAESHLDHQSMQKDDLKECCICKHTCFFTSITCPCSPTKLACLRHARILCKDPLEQKTLIQWIQMGELKFAIRRVQEKIRTLKNQEQKPKDTVVISH